MNREGRGQKKKAFGEEGRRRARSSTKKVIDETRWELLKLWHGAEAANKWDREWERTTSWDSEGGRILDWTLTSELRRSRGLKLMVRAHTLTADPSYEQYLEERESNRVQQGDRIMVPLQEIGGQYRHSWMDACIEKGDHWVMIARKGDVSTEQIRALEQHGKLAGRVKPASRGCLYNAWRRDGGRRERGRG